LVNVNVDVIVFLHLFCLSPLHGSLPTRRNNFLTSTVAGLEVRLFVWGEGCTYSRHDAWNMMNDLITTHSIPSMMPPERHAIVSHVADHSLASAQARLVQLQTQVALLTSISNNVSMARSVPLCMCLDPRQSAGKRCLVVEFRSSPVVRGLPNPEPCACMSRTGELLSQDHSPGDHGSKCV